MKTKIQNNSEKDIYDWIPDTYTQEEKEEILRVIHEYNAICLEILNNSTSSSQENW